MTKCDGPHMLSVFPKWKIHSLHRKFVHKILTKIHLREFGGEVIKLNDSFLYSVSHAFRNNSCLKPAKKQPAFLSLCDMKYSTQHEWCSFLFSFFKRRWRNSLELLILWFLTLAKSSKNFDDNLIIFKE